MNKIIDLSQFNDVRDWDAVKAYVDKIIIRVGFTYSVNGFMCVDTKYAEHRKMCEKLSIPYSLYYFTNATTPEEAEREAAFVVHECRDIKAFTLPVFVDTEKVSGTGRADNLPKEQRTACVKAFCSYLQACGVPAGIYCSHDWLNNRLDRSKLPFSLWLAHWAAKPATNDYTIWQYTNKGVVPGINGYVDMSSDRRQNPIDRVIALELDEVGYVEKKTGDLSALYDKTANAGSNNYTKYGYELHSIRPDVISYPDAWCADFQSWAFVELFGLDAAKVALCGDIDDYCPNMVRRFQKAGRWHVTPKPGDLVFFKNSLGIACHVGMVYKTGDRIYTIEGNTSGAAGVVANGGCVRTKYYPATHAAILGFGRPDYDKIT